MHNIILLEKIDMHFLQIWESVHVKQKKAATKFEDYIEVEYNAISCCYIVPASLISHISKLRHIAHMYIISPKYKYNRSVVKYKTF
jgi:hypothetical protein